MRNHKFKGLSSTEKAAQEKVDDLIVRYLHSLKVAGKQENDVLKLKEKPKEPEDLSNISGLRLERAHSHYQWVRNSSYNDMRSDEMWGLDYVPTHNAKMRRAI